MNSQAAESSSYSAIVIAAWDATLKFGSRVVDSLLAHGVSTRLIAPTTFSPHMLSPEQITAATRHEIEFMPWWDMLDEARNADIVVPMFDGFQTERVIRQLRNRESARPLPVIGTGYVGMVLHNAINGYIDRSLADVIAVNSRSDYAQFEEVAIALGLPTDSLLLTGLPLIPAELKPMRTGPIRRVLFADQPSVPRSPEQRAVLYEQLAKYAKAHPDREVAIRPRARLGEQTFHDLGYHPETYLASGNPPPNLVIDHRPIVEQFNDSDLVLSTSSTSILEAIAAGCRVAFVADFFGEKYLNHRFLHSGLLRTTRQIIADDIGTPTEAWLNDVFPRAGTPMDVFVRRLIELVPVEDRPHERAWNNQFHQLRLEHRARYATIREELGIPKPRKKGRWKPTKAEKALRKVFFFLSERQKRTVVRKLRKLFKRKRRETEATSPTP